VRGRANTAALAVGLVGLTDWLAGGCAGLRSERYERDRMVADLSDALRDEALKLPDGDQRERLVQGLIQVHDMMVGAAMLKPEPSGGGPKLPEPEGGAAPAPPWAVMFAPKGLVIGFFTRSRNFDNIPGDDGLEVRVQPLDQFGDPTKAVGSYRIEMFAYRLQSEDKRGQRLGHWFVRVLDADANRKYYDPIDRSYVFPLLWNYEVEPGTAVIVQATYYPPGGFEEKLFAQRVIKIGAEGQ